MRSVFVLVWEFAALARPAGWLIASAAEPAPGCQGITAMNPGSVDECLDGAVPSYAELHRYPGEEHND